MLKCGKTFPYANIFMQRGVVFTVVDGTTILGLAVMLNAHEIVQAALNHKSEADSFVIHFVAFKHDGEDFITEADKNHFKSAVTSMLHEGSGPPCLRPSSPYRLSHLSCFSFLLPPAVAIALFT